MSAIDWQGIPLRDFSSKLVEQGDGTYNHVLDPYGDGEAQLIMMRIGFGIDSAYEAVLPEEALDWWGDTGEVPVLRDGKWGHEGIQTFTFRDVPVVMDTLVELEKEQKRWEREEAERRAARRKERKRVLAKERRKRQKLGEWNVETGSGSDVADRGDGEQPTPFWP